MAATDHSTVHRVVILAFDGVQSLDVVGPAEVFAGATGLAESYRYDVTIASVDGGVVPTESAVALAT